LDLLNTARAEKYNFQAQSREAKAEQKRLELKIKKIEVQHDVDKKRHAQAIKNKEKMKFMQKGLALETAFKEELNHIREQYLDSKLLHSKKDQLIARLGLVILK